MNKVYLKISCWAGMSLGAEHYYGNLTGHYPNHKVVELKKILTEKEAEVLNKKDNCSEYCRYEAGAETERFDSEAEVKAVALAKWKEYFPDGKFLFYGSSCSADPTLILVAPEPIFTKGNELFQRAKHIGFWDYNEDAMQEIADEWDLLFKEA